VAILDNELAKKAVPPGIWRTPGGNGGMLSICGLVQIRKKPNDTIWHRLASHCRYRKKPHAGLWLLFNKDDIFVNDRD